MGPHLYVVHRVLPIGPASRTSRWSQEPPHPGTNEQHSATNGGNQCSNLIITRRGVTSLRSARLMPIFVLFPKTQDSNLLNFTYCRTCYWPVIRSRVGQVAGAEASLLSTPLLHVSTCRIKGPAYTRTGGTYTRVYI
jgi:hypothetical protein